MTHYAKLSALGVVLVVATACASADPISVNSGSATVELAGYSSTISDIPTYGTAAAVYNISAGNNGVWSGPGSNSNWVSFDPSSGPTGGESAATSDPNGAYTYTSTFKTTGGVYAGILSVLADDTTNVLLNGVQILPEGTIGNDAHCAEGPTNCLEADTISLGSALASFNNDGLNTLTFVVLQTGGSYQGLDFDGFVSQVPTPEPDTLILLGTGLLAAAGVMFRTKRVRS